jgi:hypothetical protein
MNDERSCSELSVLCFRGRLAAKIQYILSRQAQCRCGAFGCVAGAEILDEARELWWSDLRVAEEEAYRTAIFGRFFDNY